MNAAALMQDMPALVTGIGAAVCLVAAPMFDSRRMILMAQLGAGLLFAVHYACLEIAVAAGVNILGSVQTGAALFSTRSTAMNRLGYALICLMALVSVWFWQGPVSALSLAAMTLIALGRMQADQLRLRLLFLAGGVFWVMHDFSADAWIALVADIGAIVMGLAALFFDPLPGHH